MIPLFRPSYDNEEVEAVAEALRSGWVGLGPRTAQFEKEFAQYLGSPYCVALNSGTAALHLALLSLNLSKGDEVIVTPITFVSTAHVIRYVGATPVFADVELDTLNIDPKDIDRKISDRTKAILVVHYGGHPCDMDVISKSAKNHGITVIEDAAHACGAEYKGRKVGTISPLTCFSFHAVKNLATGEGGAITFQESKLDPYFREMRWMGISKDTWDRTSKGEVYAWKYTVNRLGFKYHMHDISAAIGLVQLHKLDKNNDRRRAIAAKYSRELKDLDWIEVPVEKSYAKSSWHIYRITLPNLKMRDALIGHLKQKDISPGVHYYPINLYPYYDQSKHTTPVASQVWERILSIPMFPDLTEQQQDYIIQAIKSFPANKYQS
ncbi:MAG: DegT/DnrJ/EryC1/StrS aminotransferase family protein [Candidatus Bathyarchaeia archaeon]